MGIVYTSLIFGIQVIYVAVAPSTVHNINENIVDFARHCVHHDIIRKIMDWNPKIWSLLHKYTPGCDVVTYSEQYNQVCGRIIGYQYGILQKKSLL